MAFAIPLTFSFRYYDEKNDFDLEVTATGLYIPEERGCRGSFGEQEEPDYPACIENIKFKSAKILPEGYDYTHPLYFDEDPDLMNAATEAAWEAWENEDMEDIGLRPLEN